MGPRRGCGSSLRQRRLRLSHWNFLRRDPISLSWRRAKAQNAAARSIVYGRPTHPKTNGAAPAGEKPVNTVRAIASTRLDLASLGLDSTVYLKGMKDERIEDELTVAVHAADGELIAYAVNAAEAEAWASGEGLAVASVH